MSNPNHDKRTGEFAKASGHNAGKGHRKVASHVVEQHKEVAAKKPQGHSLLRRIGGAALSFILHKPHGTTRSRRTANHGRKFGGQ